jgi:hypothetical protein
MTQVEEIMPDKHSPKYVTNRTTRTHLSFGLVSQWLSRFEINFRNVII